MPTQRSDDPWRFNTINVASHTGREALFAALTYNRERQAHVAADCLLRHLKGDGVQSVVVEDPYHDRDYADEYSQFYSKTFRPGRKACKRFHFFRCPEQKLAEIFAPDTNEKTRWENLGSLANADVYRGFCVVRPNTTAPIGRTVLGTAKICDSIGRIISGEHPAHLFGAKFSVRGFPFAEQDGRTGACAQFSLWMVLRHLNSEGKVAQLTVPWLTAAATAIPDDFSTISMPIGSGGVHPSNLVRAIAAAGRHPHYFCAQQQRADGTFLWNEPEGAITTAFRYIDSGLPTILLTADATSSRQRKNSNDVVQGHALAAFGYYGNLRQRRGVPKERANVANWIDGLIVHNDQRGVNLNLPAAKSASHAQRGYSGYTGKNIYGIIVPLPDKVFLLPSVAEELAWAFITKHSLGWNRQHFQGQNATAAGGMNESSLAARTFLIKGHDHYAWLAKSNAPESVCQIAAQVHMPSHVWLTEFYKRTPEGDVDLDNVSAHVVSDATSHNRMPHAQNSAFLFGHRPGLVFGVVTTGIIRGGVLAQREIERDNAYSSMNPMRTMRD